MKDYTREVSLICPLCGNDIFSSLDEEIENILEAPELARFQCADCKSIYTKDELMEANTEKFEIARDEIANDLMKDLTKDLSKAFRKVHKR